MFLNFNKTPNSLNKIFKMYSFNKFIAFDDEDDSQDESPVMTKATTKAITKVPTKALTKASEKYADLTLDQLRELYDSMVSQHSSDAQELDSLIAGEQDEQDKALAKIMMQSIKELKHEIALVKTAIAKAQRTFEVSKTIKKVQGPCPHDLVSKYNTTCIIEGWKTGTNGAFKKCRCETSDEDNHCANHMYYVNGCANKQCKRIHDPQLKGCASTTEKFNLFREECLAELRD